VSAAALIGGWSWEPSVVAGLGLLISAYVVTALRGGSRQRPRVAQVCAFLGSLAVVVLALLSPLDRLADRYLFSAHMVQHLLLIMAVPPLFLTGLPRQWLHGLTRPPLARVERLASHPLVALGAFSACFGLWHVPNLYEAALREERVHVLEHLSFLFTATLFWWPVIHAPLASAGLGYLGRMVYLFVASVPNSAVGALLALAPDPLYATYATPPDPGDPVRVLLRDGLGLSPLADQQLGGLLMWIPGGLLYLLAIWVLGLRWIHTENVAAGRGTPTQSSGRTS
jgi:cytochrome c oxidase assembly factor CtaG